MASFVTTIRSRVSTRRKARRVGHPSRDPEGEETVVLKALAEMLRPTVLEPFKPFERPWIHGKQSDPATDRVTEIRRFVSSVEATLDSFTARVPEMLKFPASRVLASGCSPVLQAMSLRMNGDSYEAICVLANQLDSGGGDPDLPLLHYADTLWDLGLHGATFRRTPSFKHDPQSSDKIKAAIMLSKAVDGLFGGIAPNFSLDKAISPAATRNMLEVPPRGDAEVYATIVYCHLLIIRYRFACLVDYAKATPLSALSTRAAVRLLSLWHEVKDDIHLDNGKFIRWRCATAVRECFPCNTVDLGQCGRQDALCLLTAHDLVSSSVDHDTIAAFHVLRDMRSEKPVQHSALIPLETHLKALMGRNDLRAVHELLLALQMPLPADFHGLQKKIRRAGWNLHEYMMPCSPWVMDGALLHPYSLWIGEEYRCGRTKNSSWFPAFGKYPGHGELAQPKTCISRLHISFDQLCRQSDSPQDEQVVNGGTFIYAWSILYWSVQYTSAPLEDEVYRRLFSDYEVFSFSQLFNRVRQVCHCALADEPAFRHLSLNGFDSRHRQVAGLGAVQIDMDSSKSIDLLSAEVSGLAALRDELASIALKSPSAGLRHLLGMLVVYEGYAHLEKAEQMAKTFDRHGFDQHGQATPGSRGPSAVKSELFLAKGLFEEAFKDYQDAKLGEITRQAGEGLIRVQDELAHVETRLTGNDDADRRAQDMLDLCNRLRVPLRARLIQAYGTPAHLFKWKGKEGFHSLFTGIDEPASILHEAGERSLHQLGQDEAAFDWLHGASEDWSSGRKLRSAFRAASQRPAMAAEPVFTTAGALADHRDEEVARLAEQQLSVDISQSIWSRLSPEIPRAVIVQFSLSRPEHESARTESKVQIHLRHSDGTSARTESQNLTWGKLQSGKGGFYTEEWDSELFSPLRELDELVTALYGSAETNELVILVPGPVCRSVLLHALQVSTDRTLSRTADVVYAPELDTFATCLERGQASPGRQANKWRATAATVWESGGEEKDVAATKVLMSGTVDDMAKYLDIKQFKHEEVTKAVFSKAVRESECLFFLGHGGAATDEQGTVYPPNLILHGDETFEIEDFQTVPASLTFLLACSTAEERDTETEQFSNLADAALSAGGVAAVGTRIVIWNDALMMMALLLAFSVGEARRNLPPGQRFNLAKTLRNCLNTAYKNIDIVERNKLLLEHQPKLSAEQLWGGFVQVGSPLMDLHYEQAKD